jgi:predicted secreted protein
MLGKITMSKRGNKVKRIILVSMFFLLFPSFMCLNAQWATTYGGSSRDSVSSIQQTSDGGYIVAGHTYSFGRGSSDIWILKLSSAGDVEWQKTYGGSEHDSADSIQQTSDGGYIVAGEIDSFGAGGNDIWFLKLTSAGDIEWQRAYEGSGNDSADSILQTNDGGYIVRGSITFSEEEQKEQEIWILKLSSAGDVEWQKTYGGSGNDSADSIQQTSDGGYIVIWVLKLSSAGDVEWQRAYGGSEREEAHSIQQTDDGGYIVAGETGSFGAGGNDTWILKLSTAGDVEWQKTYGGSGYSSADSIQQTSDGGYIVVDETGSFGLDTWILKLSSAGDVEWQKTYGGSGNDSADSIQQTSDGGYIV